MSIFPVIQKCFPDFQVDTEESDNSIKIRLSTMFIDLPFYLIHTYYNKDEEFLKKKIYELFIELCKIIRHYHNGLMKHDPEKAKKLKIDWTKFV